MKADRVKGILDDDMCVLLTEYVGRDSVLLELY